MTLALTAAELDQIVDLLTPDFWDFVEDYDDLKYPADAHQLLIEAFKEPRTTSDGDIERALRWKYGHWRKINYPIAQRHLAERIAREWRVFSAEGMRDPKAIFEYWMDALKGKAPAPYITVTFLLHLLLPEAFPIIDQHTFRSMNWLLKSTRPEWQGRKAPRGFEDLISYKEFFDSLHSAWQSRETPPSRSHLDRGLMSVGQALKAGRFPRSSRIQRAGRPAKCPHCHHSPVAVILWGLPSFDPKLEADLNAGRLVLGGCCVSDDDPAWQCPKCDLPIYRKRGVTNDRFRRDVT